MPKAKLDWYSIDTSDWHLKSDGELADRYGVDKSVIDYWRKKFGIVPLRISQSKEREAKFKEGFQWCSRCQRYLPLDQFDKSRKERFGYKTHCKSCRHLFREENQDTIRERRSRYYQEHRAEILERNRHTKNKIAVRAYMKVRTTKLKEQFVDLAGRHCQRCGYSEFVSGLEFHHVDPEGKEQVPTKAINSGDFDRAYAELDKCVLLCRNCHQSFHASDWTAEFVKRDGLGWSLKE